MEDDPIATAAGLVAAGRFDAALRLLGPLPADHPGRHAVLGAAHLGRKEAGAALDHLQRAAAQAPEDAATRLLLGRAHLLAADPAAAIHVFEGLAAEFPDRPGLADALAGAYRRDARYADAIRIAEVAADPGEQLRYEQAVALACLGDGAGALAAFDALLARAPHLAAAWYGSHGPALECNGLADAMERLERAAACPRANGRYRAMLAAYDVLAGRPPRPHGRKHGHLPEAAAALRPGLAPDCRLFGLTASLLRHALTLARRPGLVLEFGVRRGTSTRVLAAAAGQEVHGFDSFEGLPEAWGSAPAGALTTGRRLPDLGPRVRLHPGWFEDTLPPFLAAHPGPVRFANIDCDLYSSTRTVLTALAERIGPGTVLVFDEFVGNRTWRADEFRAFAEFKAQTGLEHRILAVNPAGKQVALEIV